jgi:glutamyl/glutaminyl-tRNA synthetase
MMRNQNHVIKNQNEMTENQDHITKNEKISIDTLIFYNVKTQLMSQFSLTLKEVSNTMKDNVDQKKKDQSRSFMRKFKQQNQNDVISFTKILQLLFKIRMNKKKYLFTMLSLMIDNRFYEHQVDSLNKLSMITALELSYES